MPQGRGFTNFAHYMVREDLNRTVKMVREDLKTQKGGI